MSCVEEIETFLIGQLGVTRLVSRGVEADRNFFGGVNVKALNLSALPA